MHIFQAVEPLKEEHVACGFGFLCCGAHAHPLQVSIAMNSQIIHLVWLALHGDSKDTHVADIPALSWDPFCTPY